MIAIVESLEPAGVCMDVVEYELGSWYLLSDGDEYYLDIRTGLFGYSFWLLMRLEASECEAYRLSGEASVETLVAAIRRRPHFYFLRNEPIAKQSVVLETVTTWRQSVRRPKV
jgi:hypothetical protein